MPRARLTVDRLESRLAPARVLGPTRLAYQDKDGDAVTVTFSKPVLNFGDPNAVFAFDSGPGAVNGATSTPEQLRRIDLTGVPVAAAGVGITVTATRGPAGGDGFAAVGEVVATGIDLGAVKVDGDLGRILAGSGSAGVVALAGLAAQSLGRYGTATGAANVLSAVRGTVGSVAIRGDVAGGLGVQGGDLRSLKVGGSLLGGSTAGCGQVAVDGALVRGVIGGDVVGGTASATGQVGATAIGSLAIGGSILGGSATGSAPLVEAGAVVGGRIGKVSVGGSVVAGTDATTGAFAANGAVVAFYDIGSVTVRGSLAGNRTARALIAAGGPPAPAGGRDVAIGSVAIRGRVEDALIQAGAALDANFAFQPVDADAQIGAVSVGGDWAASSLVAGATAGPDGQFGTADDARMAGPGVADDPAIASAIGSVTIGGQVLGTPGGTDHYGFVAEAVGAVRVGGTPIGLIAGAHNDDTPVGVTGDVAIREV